MSEQPAETFAREQVMMMFSVPDPTVFSMEIQAIAVMDAAMQRFLGDDIRARSRVAEWLAAKYVWVESVKSEPRRRFDF